LQQNLNRTANGGLKQIFALSSNGGVGFFQEKGSDRPGHKCHFTECLVSKVGGKNHPIGKSDFLFHKALQLMG